MKLWLALNSTLLAVLSAVTFLLLRQVGHLLYRAGAVGARGTSAGPRIGESIAGHFDSAIPLLGKSKLLVFVSEQCGICGIVREGAIKLSADWRHDSEIFLIYDCSPGDRESEFSQIRSGLHEKKDQSLRTRLAVTFVPFAVVTDPSGVVVGKGLVNDVSHLESLLELEQAQRRKALSSDPAELSDSSALSRTST